MRFINVKVFCTFLATTLLLGVGPAIYAACMDAPAFGGGELFIDTGDDAETVLMIGQPTVGRVEDGAAYAVIGGVVCWSDDRDLVGDLDGNDCVNLADQAWLLGNYNQQGCHVVGDIVRDGVVNISDLSALMGNYGQGDGCP